jgi:acyl-CoA synthetase (AMP-forming)/AMP-acid ligase II
MQCAPTPPRAAVLPPTVWISLLRHPEFDRRDLSSLQKGYYGASAMPAVAEVAVFGIPHPYWVEAVTAAVVAKPGAGVEAAELVAHARARLAAYKVPKYLVVVDSLPKNPSGKILKRELRDSHAYLAASPG